MDQHKTNQHNVMKQAYHCEWTNAKPCEHEELAKQASVGHRYEETLRGIYPTLPRQCGFQLFLYANAQL